MLFQSHDKHSSRKGNGVKKNMDLDDLQCSTEGGWYRFERHPESSVGPHVSVQCRKAFEFPLTDGASHSSLQCFRSHRPIFCPDTKHRLKIIK